MDRNTNRTYSLGPKAEQTRLSLLEFVTFGNIAVMIRLDEMDPPSWDFSLQSSKMLEKNKIPGRVDG